MIEIADETLHDSNDTITEISNIAEVTMWKNSDQYQLPSSLLDAYKKTSTCACLLNII
jgi:hypothetical protein